jgi:hypothetical protein
MNDFLAWTNYEHKARVSLHVTALITVNFLPLYFNITHQSPSSSLLFTMIILTSHLTLPLLLNLTQRQSIHT